MDTIVKYVMKFKFVVKFVVKFGEGRTKGDIEALADARRVLKNGSFGKRDERRILGKGQKK